MFDIDQILSKVYELDSQKKSSAALDVIIEFFWDAADIQDFESMDLFYQKIDLSKITLGAVICCAPMNTFGYIPQVPNHLPYCAKAIARYKELGYDDAWIHDIMDRFLEVGSFWRDIAILGAPEWLVGQKP